MTENQEQTHTIKTQFGFTEGLYFGCGFFLAAAIFVAVVVPSAAIAFSFIRGLFGF